VLLGFAVAAALGQVPASVSAQQLEEIVVTARKTEESLMSAPVTVSAFTATTIREKGLTTIDDIARFTPGLSFSQAFGRTTDRPVIRGQSNVLAGVQFGVESGAAYFIDGVYFPGDVQGIDLNALERVEVIRGPQSALYGRNTYSGAINFITRQPTGDLEARVRAVAAEYGEQDYSFSIGNSFFDERFGGKLFARSYSYDGEYKNTLTGRKVGDESTRSVGLSLYWQPVEDLRFLANGFYREDDDGPLALFLAGASLNNCRPGFRSQFYRDPPGPATRGTNPNQYYCGVVPPGTVALNTDPIAATGGRDGTAFDGVETDEYFGTLRADWNIMGSGWTVTSLSGYRDHENLFGTDSDHSGAFVLAPNYDPVTGGFAIPGIGASNEKEPLFANTNRNDVRSLSTELRIASPQDRRLRGLVGYYYYDYEDDGSDLTFAHPRRGGAADNTETVRDEAAFGLVAFDITDSVTLTAELRYQEETRERSEFCSTAPSTGDYNPWTDSCTNWGPAFVNFVPVFHAPGVPGFYNRPLGTVQYDEEAEFDSTTPRVTLDWRINEAAMVYAVYAQGARPGGLNGIAGRNVGQPTYEQEESENFELGTKLSLFDDRMRLGVAAYYTEATDVQFTQSVPSPTGQGAVTSIATNQGEGESRGLELELQAAITEALTMSASYAYTDTEITRGCDDFQYTLNTGGLVFDPSLGAVPECSIKGNRYPLVPEEAASLAFNYDAPLSTGNGLNLVSNFSTTYEGSKYVQVHDLAATGNTTVVNLRLGIRSDNGWSIVAFGRNLTDNETIPMATRWFDLRTGSAYPSSSGGAPCVQATSLVPCSGAAGATSPTGFPVTGVAGRANGADIGSPRTLFGALRKGRTFGIEFTYDFKL
jgi:outer membrane receptor protein involved in Fe transport